MKQMNLMLSAGYTVILGICMLLSSRFSIIGLCKIIAHILAKILGAIFSLIPYAEGEEPHLPIVKEQPRMVLPEEGEPSLFLMFLEKVLYFLIAVAMILGILYAMVKIVRFLYQRFYHKASVDFVEEQEIPQYLTPTQQAAFKETSGQNSSKEVITLYELARYSEEPLEKKHVLQMQNLIKQKIGGEGQ